MLGMFDANAYDTLMKGARGAELVGTETVSEVAAEHVAVRFAQATMDLWVDGRKLELLRARLDATKAVQGQNPGQSVEELTMTVDYTMELPSPAAAAAEDWSFKLPAGAKPFAATPSATDLKGKPMIDFTLPGLEGKSTWHLAELKGKVIIIDFWYAGCEPCKEELPALQKILAEFKDRGLALIAVNIGDTAETVRKFLAAQKLDVPVALDTRGETAIAYGLEGFPTLVLVGRDGIIRAVHVGYGPGSADLARAEVKQLLAEATPSK